ncbi:hypothetical protein BH11MYX4_BH11MYX4_11870 [soil metagenome]
MKSLAAAAVLLVTALPACGGYGGEILRPIESNGVEAAAPSAGVVLGMRSRVELARRLVDSDAGPRRDADRAVELVDGACTQAFAAHCASAVEIALAAGKDRLAETWAVDGCATAEFACSSAAQVLDEGRGGRPNPAAAKHLYKLGCERGSDDACRRLGTARSAKRPAPLAAISDAAPAR